MITLSAFQPLSPGGFLDLRLEVKEGEHLGVIGPSGAGKTTLLKILAGLVQPDSGSLSVNGQVWLDTQKGICMPPQKRSIGFVFQEYALFPNMTVQQNLAFAFSGPVNGRLLESTMQLLDIGTIRHQKPAILSGGQKQRVALGRALLREPDLLLLDEPLSALDPVMREQLQEYLQEIASRFEGTIVLVSHNPVEIIRLTDRAIILEGGTIRADGNPVRLLSRQKSGQTGAAKVIDILPEDNVCIVQSEYGLVQLPYHSFEHANLDIGDQVTLALMEKQSERKI